MVEESAVQGATAAAAEVALAAEECRDVSAAGVHVDEARRLLAVGGAAAGAADRAVRAALRCLLDLQIGSRRIADAECGAALLRIQDPIRMSALLGVAPCASVRAHALLSLLLLYLGYVCVDMVCAFANQTPQLARAMNVCDAKVLVLDFDAPQRSLDEHGLRARVEDHARARDADHFVAHWCVALGHLWSCWQQTRVESKVSSIRTTH